jgi:hypothetical protein
VVGGGTRKQESSISGRIKIKESDMIPVWSGEQIDLNGGGDEKRPRVGVLVNSSMVI